MLPSLKLGSESIVPGQFLKFDLAVEGFLSVFEERNAVSDEGFFVINDSNCFDR
jgi:hypothetical protein